MNNVRCPQPLITPCHGGEAESITRVSRILAQRRVRRRTGWFAPCTSSLTAVRIAYYSSSQPLELRFNYRLLGLGRTDASRPSWPEVRRPVLPDQARHIQRK